MQRNPINPNDEPNPESPGEDPVEGAPKMEFPGADTDVPADRNEDLPERLGERIDSGPDRGMVAGEPDLLPDVDPPEHTM